MGNILFQNQPSPPNNQILNQLKNSGPSNIIFNKLYNSNPKFRQFADSVRNMTPEQAFRANGLDFEQFRNQRW